VQFAEIARALGGDVVDAALQRRTVAWMVARRDGAGGYQRNPRALDTFGRAAKATTDAYIVWSLSEADLIFAEMESAASGAAYAPSEALRSDVEALRREAEEGESATPRSAEGRSDAYVEALAACALFNVEANAAGERLVAALLAKQDAAGRVPYTRGTITASGETSRDVETTALALLAFVKAPAFAPLADAAEAEAGAAVGGGARRAAAWLAEQCGGGGSWGTTQATVLALKVRCSCLLFAQSILLFAHLFFCLLGVWLAHKAIIAYDLATAQPKLRGALTVALDGVAITLALPLIAAEESGAQNEQRGGGGGAELAEAPFIRADGTLVFPASALAVLVARSRAERPSATGRNRHTLTMTLALNPPDGGVAAAAASALSFTLPWTASVSYRAVKPPAAAVTFGAPGTAPQRCAVEMSVALSAERVVEGAAVDVAVQLSAVAAAKTDTRYSDGALRLRLRAPARPPTLTRSPPLPRDCRPQGFQWSSPSSVFRRGWSRASKSSASCARRARSRTLKSSGAKCTSTGAASRTPRSACARAVASFAAPLLVPPPSRPLTLRTRAPLTAPPPPPLSLTLPTRAVDRLSFSFDALAATPGTFTAPASRAWLYYTPERTHWVAAPLAIAIDPIGGAPFEEAFAIARARDSRGAASSTAAAPGAQKDGTKKWYEEGPSEGA
jgi:hypothetical protein